MTKGETVIRKIIYVDEGKGERAIEKIRKTVEKMYEDPKFVRGNYCLTESETLWEENSTSR
jgi:hypothetical protein